MKEKKITSTVWPFEVDKVATYAWSKEVFTPEECEQIIDISKAKGTFTGGLSSKSVINKKIRDSDIVFMHPNELKFAYQKLTNSINYINNTYFKFDIFGFAEGLQFTVYQKNQKYGRHFDRAYKTMTRKLSVSVQLSDPQKYKGGDLVLYEGADEIIAKRDQGSITVFPSFIEHEVRPVKKGTRYSLVGWITGKDFK